MEFCCYSSTVEAAADRHFSKVHKEVEYFGGITMPLNEMQVRSSQHHALADDISPNKVLRKENMKDSEGERNRESMRPRESQYSGKETDRPEHARRHS